MEKGDEFNESAQLQGGMFFTLSSAYALLTVVSLIQFIRIQLRLRQHIWTTQKVFALMNIFVNGVRAAVFVFHMFVVLKPNVLTSVLVDLPALLFFTTYTLLVVFWAEIWYQAKGFSADKLKARYISANCVIYIIQVLIWISLWLYDNSFVRSMSQVFIAVVSIIAASGFLLFGLRLYMMLFNFPVQSKGRQQKLHEVKSVAAICVAFYLIRCFTAAASAFNADASLKVLDQPTTFDLIYYMDIIIWLAGVYTLICQHMINQSMEKGDEFNESAQLHGGMFFTLSAAYALLTVVSLIQFIIIQLRLRQHGWSTLKVFVLVNIFINGVRAAVFGFHMLVVLKPNVLTSVLVDLPGLLFFSTYTLLVDFWAEIWYRAKGFSADKLKARYISANCVIYIIQVLIWISLWLYDNSFVRSMSQVFIAASGFLLFGGRLYMMLFNFPVGSKGRQAKLNEVKSVAAICVASFLIRCFTAAASAFNADTSLRILHHPTTFDLIYYMLVEILPCALVLFIHRKLPPKIA